PAHGLERLVVGRRLDLETTGGGEGGDLRPDARVVEARRRRVRLEYLAVTILEHHRARAVKDPGRPTRERRRVTPGRDPLPRGLGNGQPNPRFADEPVEQPDRVRATTDARQGEVRQTAFHLHELRRRLVADPALEVAHDRWVRVRAHRRAEDIVRRLDV